MSSRVVRTLASTIAGAALVSAVAAAPSMAAGHEAFSAKDAPVVVDGVRHSAAEMSQLAGTRLFVASPKAGGALVAFTDATRFRAFVREQLGVKLTGAKARPVKAPRRPSKKARAAWSGDFTTFYQHYNGYGWSFNINSGYGEPDLGRVGCFLWWCSNYNNQISSVRTHGTSAVLYDYEGYYGDVYVVGPNQLNNIPSWFNDRASSAYTAWSW